MGTLRNPELSGELIEDDLGTRIGLRLNWERIHPGKPVELAGWLLANSNSANKENDNEETKEDSEDTENTTGEAVSDSDQDVTSEVVQ